MPSEDRITELLGRLYEQRGQGQDIDIEALAADHPDLGRTFTWGQSVLGRDLSGLVVAADVHNTAAEPEVRLSSTMHGLEPPDMVMLLNLAAYLVNNYGQPGYEDVTYLVDYLYRGGPALQAGCVY